MYPVDNEYQDNENNELLEIIEERIKYMQSIADKDHFPSSETVLLAEISPDFLIKYDLESKATDLKPYHINSF